MDIHHHFVLRPYRSVSILGQKNFLWVLMFSLIIQFAIFVGAWKMFGYANTEWTNAAVIVMLGFLLFPSFLVLGALALSNRRFNLREELTVTREKLTLQRFEPGGEVETFETDPHWVKIELTDTQHTKSYLTLRDHKRHVELGAFLPLQERQELHKMLTNLQFEIVSGRA